MDERALANLIQHTIRSLVRGCQNVTRYREPLCAWMKVDDLRWDELRTHMPDHMTPDDLLPGVRSVVAFFLPFAPASIKANRPKGEQVAEEWVRAYLETNDLIKAITRYLIHALAQEGVRAAAEPPTDNFDRETLTSRWSHKSVAVAAGLGSFGVHHMVITDAGCCGRLGSLVIDADLPETSSASITRCLYKHDGTCTQCVERCPIGALMPTDGIDRQACWNRCLKVMDQFSHLGRAEVCGKCAFGPCAFTNPVKGK